MKFSIGDYVIEIEDPNRKNRKVMDTDISLFGDTAMYYLLEDAKWHYEEALDYPTVEIIK